MVLLGTSGAGKSASGNTILQRKAFKSTCFSFFPSVASECQKETAEFEGQRLTAVDTPGMFDPRRNENKVKREIVRSISSAVPGPHVFLVVLKPFRFRGEEKHILSILEKLIGKEAACYTMIVFTNGDYLEEDEVTIDILINHNSDLRDFTSQCHGGYHVFNNRKKDPSQVRELLQKIGAMVQRNGGNYYTKEMYKEVHRARKEGKERRQRDRKRTSLFSRVLNAVG